MLKLCTLALSLVMFCGLPVLAAHAASIETKAKQAIVVDYETGTVLLSKNMDEQMPTSSMSKVMTMYAVFDSIKNGQISLNDTLPVSEKAWRMGGSKMFVEVDKRVKVEDLIRGVIVQSGNDATVVLAEGLAGSENAFANMINDKATGLGMKNSHFVNASGWPDPEHYSTARDLATLGRAIIHDFPDYYKYYMEKEFTYNNIKQTNRNPLLYRNIGADGIKTGHTEAAGYGLIGSGTQNGRRVVLVINGLEDERARAEESAKLLEWGLKRFENKKLYKAGEVIENAQIVMGQSAQVGLSVDEDVFLTLPKMAGANINIQVKYNGPLIAPVKKGQELGALEITIPGMETITRPLYVAEDVPELGLFAKTLAKAKLVLGGK
ncbi:MAG: D-alanyl-D-alanine carboxypeptidase [Rhodospirillales bacterium]|nr:D-alanyl-D-alanine carboxypeptidase [Alphaproteobacteria bacterium]USO06205.1 MAG: D-alanyl-D-alanine carboxypeptidase [Rhodospirillales bacterium]